MRGSTALSVFCLLLLLGACGGSAQVDPAVLGIVSPSDGGVANQARPLVRWTPVPGAVRYRLELLDAAGSMVEQGDVATAEMQLTTALADDAVYEARFVAENGRGDTVFASEPSRFRVRLTPSWMPRFEIVTADAGRRRGDHRLFNLLDVQPPDVSETVAALLLVNLAGEVLWWYEPPPVAIPDGRAITDARVLPNGNILLLRRHRSAPGVLRTVAIEISWDGDIVWESPDDRLIHHEVGLGPGDDILALTYEFQDGEPGVPYEGDGLVLWDRETKNVLWTWNLFDHFDPAQWPTPEAQNDGLSLRGRDWSHANAAVWDPGRSLIWMSIRHFDNVIGIHYPSGQVQVILGKGGLGGPDLLRHQHAPEVQADGTLLVYDNGNGRMPQPFTRVVQLSFDPGYTQVAEVFTWRDTPTFFDFAVGDADRLPSGNVLVTAGVSGRLIETDAAGNVVWEIQMVNPPKPDRYWFYRSEHVDEGQLPAHVLPFGR